MYIKKIQKNIKLTPKIQILTEFGVNFIFYIVEDCKMKLAK